MKTQSQAGFGLIQMMIGLAILTIAMSALADMMVLNAKAQRNITSSAEINALFNQVDNIIKTDWSCTAALAGSNPANAIAIKDPADTTKIITQETAKDSRFWTVKVIRMTGAQAVANQPGIMRGTLHMEVKKNMKVSVGSPSVSHDIAQVYYDLNTNGTIANCYNASGTVAAAQSQCEMLGGTWTAANAKGKQCTLVQLASAASDTATTKTDDSKNSKEKEDSKEKK